MSKPNTGRGVSLGAEGRGSRGAAEGRSEDLLRKRGYQLADSSLQRQVPLSALSLGLAPGARWTQPGHRHRRIREEDTQAKCRHRLNINLQSKTYHCCQRGQVVGQFARERDRSWCWRSTKTGCARVPEPISVQSQHVITSVQSERR